MRRFGFILLLQILLLPLAIHAMDMPHYDLDSLVYLSTDIIIANISIDSHHKFTATVKGSLYGSLRPGEQLVMLSEFLSFFQPMEDGQEVVLFLDRRPHQPYFLYPEASKSPFAVIPSGVYLIDVYEHVHEYYQESNPGLYVAQGYRFYFNPSLPTKDEDLALPSLDEVKARISASLSYVQSFRSLLDKVATEDDATALLSLLQSRSIGRNHCLIATPDGIAAHAVGQLRSLNDPHFLLKAYGLYTDAGSELAFVQRENGNREKEFTAARVKYLIQTLSDVKADLSMRVAAVKILLRVSMFHTNPQTGPSKSLPIDNEWLADSAGEIEATAKAIFDDESQDAHLRGLCLQFLSLRQPEMIAHVTRVYSRAQSEGLRFAIEEYFLEVSDALYESLKPPGGPVASIVELVPDDGCYKPNTGEVAFFSEYRERSDFPDRWQATASSHYVLTNIQTCERFILKNIQKLTGWDGALNGETTFELTHLSDFPLGNYSLGLEYRQNGKILSSGHKVTLAIKDTSGGRTLSVMQPSNR